ncbi:MarR family transcriptional regulator [Thermoactinomyces sp. CICC 10521]|uniref:MarR family winged helix-turn-helix transcriptional regulator n=1 Tax=Thermoactinomyces sp. CICC 10521 TaxID=2767426 RepID=UPI0018DDCAD4|nr:MarR family transcriptional regulator [Thermoactinomyces sp. CICC 10521]
MTKETLPDLLTNSLGFNFGRFAAIGRKLFHQKLLPLGVDDTQLSVLAILNEKGPLVQARLSDYLGIDKATMVSLVNALKSKGLVSKKPHPSDRRAHHVYITDRGQETLWQAWEISQEFTDELFSVLSSEERAMLIDMLNRLYHHSVELQEKGRDEKCQNPPNPHYLPTHR